MMNTQTWRGFAKISSAADFKPQVGIRPSFVGNLLPLPPSGDIKHGTLVESTFPWSVSPFARIFSVDRQTVINDDLSFIAETPVLLGKSAAQTLNDLIWSTILANGGSFFSAGKSNLLTGAGSVLSQDSFGQAMSLMRSQRDPNGGDISIIPRVLALPPTLEATGRAIVTSVVVGRTDGGPTGNPWLAVVDTAVESRLTNTAFTGNSSTSWYLFAGPMDAAVIVGFLDGKESPTIETFGFDREPSKLALTFRCYHDFGCALGDPRAAVKSNGA